MTWNRIDAENAINEFFEKYKNSEYSLRMPNADSKSYELYCLSKLLKWIKERYDVKIRLVSPDSQKRKQRISFKQGVGPINKSKFSYFVIYNDSGDLLEVHTDIQVQMLGLDATSGRADSSLTSEIDIVVVHTKAEDGSPVDPFDLVLGVECKLRRDGRIASQTINEVIGIRSGISQKTQTTSKSEIDRVLNTLPTKRTRTVYVSPCSEYWLAQIGEYIKKYRQRLKQAEVVLRIWRP